MVALTEDSDNGNQANQLSEESSYVNPWHSATLLTSLSTDIATYVIYYNLVVQTS